MSQTCIGQEALRCSAEEQGAANPAQQIGWCAGAEQDVWKERMKSDFAAITKLLPKGPALRAFMAQQRLWQAYAHDAFPYDHVDAAFPWAYWGQLGRLSVVATRALQVRDIRMMIEECFAQDSDLRPQPPCDEISGKP